MTWGFFGEYGALFEERKGQFRRGFDAELHGGRENNILLLTKEALLATFSHHEVQVNLFITKCADLLRSLGVRSLVGGLYAAESGFGSWCDLLNTVTPK